MLNKKRITTITIAVIVLFVLCVSLFSCGKNNIPNGEYNIAFELENAQFLKKITLRVQSVETEKIYDLDFFRNENYAKSYMLDSGIYKIIELNPHDKDYKIEIASSSDAVSEKDYITSDTFTVTKDTDFVLPVEEIDTSGTLQWYIKNNAFTVCILIACLISLMVVRAKKKIKIIPEHDQKMQ